MADMQPDAELTAEERFQAAKERGWLAMKSNVSAEFARLLREGPRGSSRREQAAWEERMAELCDVRAMELADVGFPSFANNEAWLAESFRRRAKELLS